MNLTENLNPAQSQAVAHTEGPLLLLAGAGSGKTRVLTHRIAYIVEKGCDPFNILAITFTNKAAREMKERVNALVPYGEIWVSTFHSTCVRILRREIHKINYDNSFTIYDADDSERLIRQCIKEVGINEKQFPPKAVMGAIGSQKDELISPEEFERISASDFRLSQIAKVYTQYQKRLKANNALDFDDIIFLAVKLFRDCPDVLEKYQNRFKYIMVDEYQDTNTAQYQLVRLLAQKNENLCVVGDDDQSIYGWRGANIRNILGFEKDFPGAKVIKLEQNYRSTQTILNAANAVIGNNLGRKDKALWTENAEGESIEFYKALSDLDEGLYIAEKISAHVAEGGKYSDVAVLYRQNALSRSIEEQLLKRNIPYRLFGGVRFYDRKEVKDVLSYLKCMYNPYDDVAFRRVINVPKRGIGNTTIEKIAQHSADHDISFFDALKDVEHIGGIGNRTKRIQEFVDLIEELKAFSDKNPISLLLQETLEKTGYVLELKAEQTDEAQGRLENIDELYNKAVEFEKTSEDKSLAAFLEEVSLVADIDNYHEGDDTAVLMTLHSSKGLEFPVVIIAGFEDNIFPSYRAMTSGDLTAMEEERRLCYVGITRAREQLYITSANNRLQHGQTVYNAPSKFLKEIPPEILKTEIQSNIAPRPEKKSQGISQFAEVNKARESISISFGGKNYKSSAIPAPQDIVLDFGVGDQVKQIKYGVGVVKDISPAGADYEVSVEFEGLGVKKFMAHLSKLKKVGGD